jgi:hypothetical protein
MVGEAPIHFEEHFRGIDVQVGKDAAHDRSAGAVSRIYHHFDAAREVKLRRHFRHVGRHHIGRLFRALAAGEIAAFDDPADLLDRFAMNGRTAAHGLKPIELTGIVAARDHHAAIGLQVKDRIVQNGRGHHTDIGNFTTAGLQAAHQRITQSRGTEARIASEIDALTGIALEISTEGAPEFFNVRVQQFDIGNSADIVFPKDGGFEHWS